MNAVMNPAVVSRIVSLIPERTARALSGTAFSLEGARACSDPARLVNVARLLQWLSPLSPLSGDDQRALGLHASAPRPGHPEEAADGEELDEPGEAASVVESLRF
jgi:hypothetical protein